MTDLYSHIGRTIRDLRNGIGLSQEALAEAIGEPSNTVSRWETGTYKPSAEKLEKLARFFGESITVFFPGMSREDGAPDALLSATRGLKKSDLQQVIEYAEFRKARAILRNASKGKSSSGKREKGHG